MERASEKSEVSASYVLTTIQQTMEQCKQPIDSGHLDSQGQPVMVPVDVPGVLRASEQLGRSLALFTDKMQHSKTGFENMSPEELDRALSKEQALNTQAISVDVPEVH